MLENICSHRQTARCAAPGIGERYRSTEAHADASSRAEQTPHVYGLGAADSHRDHRHSRAECKEPRGTAGRLEPRRDPALCEHCHDSALREQAQPVAHAPGIRGKCAQAAPVGAQAPGTKAVRASGEMQRTRHDMHQ